VSAAAEKHSRKVLGKAVHERAIQRLHELWPEAKVEVKHYESRATRVTITYGAKGVHGCCRCYFKDRYDRKTGVRIAFRRALQKVRESEAAFGLAEPERRDDLSSVTGGTY
jgi:hypothetical protein